MAIVQISRIQHRTGEQASLPQLAVGEIGFATDTQRVFIGDDLSLHPPGSEPGNTEILTEHSGVAFSQIAGSDNDLSISDPEDGQILAYDAADSLWKNQGGTATGNIHLGNIANVKLLGGTGGMIPTTDGDGNLSFTTKGYVVNDITNISIGASTVVTTVRDHFMLNGSPITFSNIGGVVATGDLVVGTGTITTSTSSAIVVGSGTSFSSDLIAKTLVNSSNTIIGIVVAVTDATHLTLASYASLVVSGGAFKTAPSTLNGNSYYAKVETNNTFAIYSDSGLSIPFDSTGTLSYFSGGRVVANVLPNSSGTSAGGTDKQVQFNQSGVLAGASGFSYSTSAQTLSAPKFSGNGAAITGVQATNLVGTVPAARLSGTYAININGNATNANAVSLTNTDEVNLGYGYSGGSLQVNYRGANGAITEYGFFNGLNSGTYANIRALTFTGSGSGLTNLPATSLTGTINSARLSGTYTINISGSATTAGSSTTATTAGTVTTAAQPNITSVGTLSSLTVGGSVSASSFAGNGANLTNITGVNVVGAVPLASQLASNRTINGVVFNNTANIDVTDSTKVAKTGDSMSGFLTLLSSNPTANYHAVPKIYSDSTLVSAIAAIKANTAFSATSPGYVKLPSWLGGFIVQWGTVTDTYIGTKQYFPLPYTSGVYSFMTSNTTAQGGGVDNAYGYSDGLDGFRVGTKGNNGDIDSNYPVTWLAIGV